MKFEWIETHQVHATNYNDYFIKNNPIMICV